MDIVKPKEPFNREYGMEIMLHKNHYTLVRSITMISGQYATGLGLFGPSTLFPISSSCVRRTV